MVQVHSYIKLWMYQISAQVLAIFFLPWSVQIVMMTSRNLSLIRNKVSASIYWHIKFPSCQSFSSAVIKAFAETSAEVSHVRNTTKIRIFATIWQSIWANCDAGNQWKSNLNQSTISTFISMINPLVTLLLIGTFANLARKHCIVKTTLTLEILATQNQSLYESHQGKKQCHSEVWWT